MAAAEQKRTGTIEARHQDQSVTPGFESYSWKRSEEEGEGAQQGDERSAAEPHVDTSFLGSLCTLDEAPSVDRPKGDNRDLLILVVDRS